MKTKSESKLKSNKIRALKQRLNRIEKATGIKIIVDTSKISDKRYEKMYKSISVKNLKQNKMDVRLITQIQGTKTVFKGGSPEKVDVTLFDAEAQKRMKILQHYYKVTGKTWATQLPKNPKYYTRFKNRKQYEKWKNAVRSNAYDNLMDNLEAGVGVNSDYEYVKEYVERRGVDIVDELNTDENYIIVGINIFDSDQVVQEDEENRTIWRKNADQILTKLKDRLPKLNRYIELRKRQEKLLTIIREAKTEEYKEKAQKLLDRIEKEIETLF